jgi:hypothetical protein
METEANWFESTRTKFARLLDLPPNWDGYGARVLDRSTLERALRVLVEIVPPSAPAPYVVPSPSGGVQVEWHGATGDVEIEFNVDGSASFFMETSHSEVDELRISDQAVRAFGPHMTSVLAG